MQPGAQDPLIGQTIGSYTVQRKLGEGGMGAVYEMLHPGIGKRLALKLLHAEYAARPQIVQRFFDEARAVNLIGHPNIVDVIDFNRLPDGRAFLMMEFLEGESLSGYIHKTGALPVTEAARIAKSIASALGAAHDSGIVHRDLKPENVHLVPRPDNPRYVKVLDFGIAKLSSDLHSDPSSATRSGVVMGTPTYMSPEQAMGRTKEIDHRTDVYALGIILYEMLTGSVPFQADSFGDLMLHHLQSEPPPLHTRRPDLGEPWQSVVMRALAKKREDRYQSMIDFAAAIDAAASGRAVAGAGDATVAVSPGAIASQPPGMPQGPAGTMAYDQAAPGTQPPPQTYPPAEDGRPSTPHQSVAVEPSSKKPLIFAAAGLLAAVAAVVFFMTRGSGGGAAEPEQPPVVAAAPADAAVAAAPVPPPDAAPVAEQAPPDAAVVVKEEPKPPKPDTPIRTVKKRGKGKVKVTATPWALIEVDGKSYGQTPQTIELPVGRHKVVLKNSEFGDPITKRVNIKKDRTEKVHGKW